VEALPFSGGPTEDAGARTADNYRFQYCCAAARLLAAIAAGEERQVICEWHEDYLVLANGSVEAVSVKHRELSQPIWSISNIVSEGKLAHLYNTFKRGGENIDCCFETNRDHALSALWSKTANDRDGARGRIASSLELERDDLDCFLDHLTLNAKLPGRDHIAAAYATRHASRALDALGISGLDPSQAMLVATSLIATASQDRVADDDWGAILLASPADRERVISEKKLDARMVCTSSLAEALKKTHSARVPRLPKASSVSAGSVPPESTMTRKLRRGGLGPSTLASAGRWRALWYGHSAAHRDIPGREEELDSLREWVQDQANRSEAAAIAADVDPYGAEMYEVLMDRLSPADKLPPGTRFEDSDVALLAGAAFQLTDECLVWWSPVFDMDDDENS
jgi:Cap4-like dsDNA endonuclease family protein